jgi:putative redox protein
MKQVTATIGKDHYITHIVTPTGKSLFSDEPETAGGADAGPAPEELLAASLGACTCITLRMYADRKQWPLDKVEAHITIERDKEKNETNMTRQIRLTGVLDEHQIARLLAIANKCPVHEMLTHPIHIQTTLG